MSDARSYTHTERRYRRILMKRGEPCGICGGDIDQTLPQYHPMAWELDHIVPVARGGEHTLDNLQPSHRRCNRAKSDSLPGDDAQLSANGCPIGPCDDCRGHHPADPGVDFVTARQWRP